MNTTVNVSLFELLEEVSGGSFNAYQVYLGNQFGLYAWMAESGPLISLELAILTGLREAHLATWLQTQVADGFVTRSACAAGIKYRLDHRVREVLRDRVSVDRLLSTVLPAPVVPVAVEGRRELSLAA